MSIPAPTDDLTATVRDGLAALGTERLVVAIHDQSFPSTAAEDLGRGSPYGAGARALLAFVARLGFNGVQLGPQGETTLIDPSPYDGALLSKSPMSIALGTLRETPLWDELTHGLLAPLVRARPAGPADRVSYAYAWHATRQTLETLHARFLAGGQRYAALGALLAEFVRGHQLRLRPDAAFAALTAEHGSDDWHRWPGVTEGAVDQCLHCPPDDLSALARRRQADLQGTLAYQRHLFGQFVLHQQHQDLRRVAGAIGSVGAIGPLALYGDLQIGFSHRDVWSRRGLFRADYLMGAPPSRTNPEGQPWGYPVIDPAQYVAAAGGFDAISALDFLTTRVDRMLDEFDGMRIDHPHGLVCPWVYAADDPDPAGAVPRGARLFCSPALADHPRLAALAIPTAAQLSRDPGIARYADDWVQQLEPAQVERYGVLFDTIMARVSAARRAPGDVVCEVLSTWPFPLRAVMQRYGLGRFCVTQKADLTRADDVYRSENAGERDWIMVGNHDTPPIWKVADAWHGTAAGVERAARLAGLLLPHVAAAPLRPRLQRWLAADARHLCLGMFAELFASRARRVSVFFADLFGLGAVYNRPGVVDDANWTLRLPSDFEDLFHQRVQRGAAFNVPLALALALIARGRTTEGAAPHALARRLIAAARTLAPALDAELVAILDAALP